MSDACWTPGCKGRIVPSRDLRSTVARGGECPVCGAKYKRYGNADWKFVTERHDCPTEGCEGLLEFEVIPGQATTYACPECGNRFSRTPAGDVAAS